MPVGNDVVDLRDPHSRPAALHPRFDQRVFGRDERDALSAAPDADAGHRLRWTMWAAKESALKYLRQIEPRRPFHPREFVVHVESTTTGRVSHGSAELAVVIDATPARVHAVAVGARDADSDSVRSDVDAITGVARAKSPDVSAEVRHHAARDIARLLDMPPALIEIDGTASSAPRARCNGEPLPVEVSLSHDGDWLAWAVVPSGREVRGRRSGPGARISGAVRPVPARGRA